VKVEQAQLESLVELYAHETALKKLRLEHTRLATGDHLTQKHEEILDLSQEVSNQRAKVEEIQREAARIAGDLELVEKRVSKDMERLNLSSNSKDIQGIQHELDTLARRKDELETSELVLMESRDDEQSALDQLLERKRVLEAELDAAKTSTRDELSRLGAHILEVENLVGKVRAAATQEILKIYDQRAVRGVPIGKLLKSTCGACNMSLTSTALNDLHKVPKDEVARCPECTAILVRS
jgi:predicted  nucleic acid-binding Zn-ribbon protein